MINHYLRDHSNLAMLEFLATKLETILDEFVFVGGCITALFINDLGAPVARATLDVDSIVDVVSLSQLTIAQENAYIEFLVLCGYTHSEAFYQPFENLIVKAGKAKYYHPAAQEIIEV